MLATHGRGVFWVDEIREKKMDKNDENIRSLLIDWHNWSNEHRARLGYPRENVLSRIGGAAAARQEGNDWGDDIDHRAHVADMEQVDAIVNQMMRPHRAAISIHARNLAVGARVWRSNRPGADKVQTDSLTDEAISILRRKLRD